MANRVHSSEQARAVRTLISMVSYGDVCVFYVTVFGGSDFGASFFCSYPFSNLPQLQY